jgi:hypothetical protein
MEQLFRNFGEKPRGKEKPTAKEPIRHTILCDFFIITSMVS